MPELGVNAIYAAARALARLEGFQFRDDPHPVLGAPTLNVGTIEGGMNLNSVPDRAVIGIDIRTISGQSVQATVDDLAAALGADVSLEDVSSLDGIYTEPGTEWVHEVYEVMEPILGERPEARTASYFTDAAILAPAFDGPPTVILGPGDPQMAHQTDEYCAIDQIDAMTQAYLQIATRWCGV
jgi:succinyl-diaminopimelate desuccinylase